MIWRNLRVKYNSTECENIDFKLRHNRIYKNIVLHQINKDVRRECDMYQTDPETFMHLFLECNELKDFHLYLKKILKENWGTEFIDSVERKELFLFGVQRKKKEINIDLLNFVLRMPDMPDRRDLAHFEGKRVNVSVLFQSVLKKNVYLLYKYLEKCV